MSPVPDIHHGHSRNPDTFYCQIVETSPQQMVLGPSEYIEGHGHRVDWQHIANLDLGYKCCSDRNQIPTDKPQTPGMFGFFCHRSTPFEN
jgi:hypothetical protein